LVRAGGHEVNSRDVLFVRCQIMKLLKDAFFVASVLTLILPYLVSPFL